MFVCACMFGCVRACAWLYMVYINMCSASNMLVVSIARTQRVPASGGQPERAAVTLSYGGDRV